MKRATEAISPPRVDTPSSVMQDKSMTIPARGLHRRGKPVAVIKQGSAAVPIYRGHVRGIPRFTVAYYMNDRRHRRTFGSLEAAKEEARILALNVQRGMSSDNDLRPQDREAFRVAQSILAPFGVPLVAAVEEYAQCRRKLGDASLSAAVDDFARRSTGFVAGTLVAQVVDEFMAVKRQDGISAVYYGGLKSLLGRFKTHFSGPIASVTTLQIDNWMRSGNLSVVTRNGWLKKLKELFNFARQRGYLPKLEPTAMESLKRAKQGDTDVGILTPEQMEKLLRAASSDVLPILTIGGFAGLRGAEIARLDWSAVDLNRRIIELRANQAKTASRRIVPISDNLAAWLEPLARHGKVVLSEGLFAKVTRLARSLQIEWPHNALRHSYISYRIAVIHDAARVALEAGNSPAIIFRHYRELVTDDEAKAWFSIVPAE